MDEDRKDFRSFGASRFENHILQFPTVYRSVVNSTSFLALHPRY